MISEGGGGGYREGEVRERRGEGEREGKRSRSGREFL